RHVVRIGRRGRLALWRPMLFLFRRQSEWYVFIAVILKWIGGDWFRFRIRHWLREPGGGRIVVLNGFFDIVVRHLARSVLRRGGRLLLFVIRERVGFVRCAR